MVKETISRVVRSDWNDGAAPPTAKQKCQVIVACPNYGGFASWPGQRANNDTKAGEVATDDGLLTLLVVAEPIGTSPILLKLIAHALQSNVQRNETQASLMPGTVGGQHMLPAGGLTVFHGLHPPPIALGTYLERLARYTRASPAAFVMALSYMDTLAQRDPALLPTPLSVHRLLLAGLLVAAKLTDDHYFNNAYYGRVGGVRLAEVNRLELELLQRLAFRAHVGREALVGLLRRLAAGSLVIGERQGGSATSGGSSLGRKRRSAPSLCGSASGESPEPEAVRPAQRRNSSVSAATAATFYTAWGEGCAGSGGEEEDEDEEEKGRGGGREGAVPERGKGRAGARSGSWYFDPGEGEEGMGEEVEVEEGWDGRVYGGGGREATSRRTAGCVEVQRAAQVEEGKGMGQRLGVGAMVPLREPRQGVAGGGCKGCWHGEDLVSGQGEDEWALDMDGQGCWYTGGGAL